jgi:hypothetical protein
VVLTKNIFRNEIRWRDPHFRVHDCIDLRVIAPKLSKALRLNHGAIQAIDGYLLDAFGTRIILQPLRLFTNPSQPSNGWSLSELP